MTVARDLKPDPEKADAAVDLVYTTSKFKWVMEERRKEQRQWEDHILSRNKQKVLRELITNYQVQQITENPIPRPEKKKKLKKRRSAPLRRRIPAFKPLKSISFDNMGSALTQALKRHQSLQGELIKQWARRSATTMARYHDPTLASITSLSVRHFIDKERARLRELYLTQKNICAKKELGALEKRAFQLEQLERVFMGRDEELAEISRRNSAKEKVFQDHYKNQIIMNRAREREEKRLEEEAEKQLEEKFKKRDAEIAKQKEKEFKKKEEIEKMHVLQQLENRSRDLYRFDLELQAKKEHEAMLMDKIRKEEEDRAKRVELSKKLREKQLSARLSERVRLARERKLKEDLRANEFLERRKEEQKKLPDPKPFHHRHGLRERNDTVRHEPVKQRSYDASVISVDLMKGREIRDNSPPEPIVQRRRNSAGSFGIAQWRQALQRMRRRRPQSEGGMRARTQLQGKSIALSEGLQFVPPKRKSTPKIRTKFMGFSSERTSPLPKFNGPPKRAQNVDRERPAPKREPLPYKLYRRVTV